MDYEAIRSLTSMFFDQAKRFGNAPFLWAKRDGVYQSQSWDEVAEQVKAFASGLAAIGIAPGDRVMIVSENRPKWLIADLGIMSAGAITVPTYTTNTTSDHQHILNNSGAKAVIVSTRQLAEKVLPAAWQSTTPPVVITMDTSAPRQNVGIEVMTWDDVVEKGKKGSADIDAILAAAQRSDTACIIYTSGTGGAPKGVMLSHGAVICNCMGCSKLLESVGLGDDAFLSFLPLSHAYEHTAGQFFPIMTGAQIYYAESVEALITNLAETKPTIMTSVPRLYEMMRLKILRNIEREGGRKEQLFMKAVELGSKVYEGKPLTFVEKIQNRILDILVRRKVNKRFGGRLKAMVAGGAPLNYEVGLFFKALNVPILQGYGQTEAAPVIAANPPKKIKLHTVGPPLAGVEVKIAEDGEILVRGELVMKGYWNDPDSTAKAIKDGWLHTGDIGELDEDGYLIITDRKKDIIVNSGGDNVSPQRVEGFLTLQPEIAQAMAFGDRKPHLVALIVPNQEWVDIWAKENGKTTDLQILIGDKDFVKAIGQAVDHVNKALSPVEKVRRFTLAAEPFSVANGMMTPTMKVRRHIIKQQFGASLEGLYEDRRKKTSSPEAE